MVTTAPIGTSSPSHVLIEVSRAPLHMYWSTLQGRPFTCTDRRFKGAPWHVLIDASKVPHSHVMIDASRAPIHMHWLTFSGRPFTCPNWRFKGAPSHVLIEGSRAPLHMYWSTLGNSWNFDQYYYKGEPLKCSSIQVKGAPPSLVLKESSTSRLSLQADV